MAFLNQRLTSYGDSHLFTMWLVSGATGTLEETFKKHPPYTGRAYPGEYTCTVYYVQ